MSNVLEQALEALEKYEVRDDIQHEVGIQDAIAALKEAIKQRGKPVVWMQSDHLDKFKHNACGSDSMLARCSIRQLQPDYRPLYNSAPTIPDVDWLANVIRSVDGNHTLGAGALAEKIVEALSAAPKGE